MDNKLIDRNAELECVNTAYFLEKRVAELTEDVRDLEINRPKEPIQPKLLDAHFEPEAYPQIDTNNVEYSKKWTTIAIIGGALWLLSSLVFSIGILKSSVLSGISVLMHFGGLVLGIYSLIKNKKEQNTAKEKYIETVKQSQDYINLCNQIDEKNAAENERLKQACQNQYVKATEEYNNALTVYQQEILPSWTTEYEAVKTALDDNEKALQEVYNNNIIPGKYRNLTAVTFLASFIGTSNYDLQFAIERYDKEIDQLIARAQLTEAAAQNQLLNEINQNQQYSNYLNEQMIWIAEEGNSTLSSISNWQKADVSVRALSKIRSKMKR